MAGLGEGGNLGAVRRLSVAFVVGLVASCLMLGSTAGAAVPDGAGAAVGVALMVETRSPCSTGAVR